MPRQGFLVGRGDTGFHPGFFVESKTSALLTFQIDCSLKKQKTKKTPHILQNMRSSVDVV